ncbi:hypothetical protein C1H84_15025 [Glutamicibacter soli]|uniref:Flagellar hook-length control protein-like C-terminal domain-containing protein n=2 Tax=Glutamicibacter soli TaxID=453836 RepID=A0A365YAK0_9MICC|nr:hypothetical protein C1H84_15025 [Glutamicibacter soli]
MPPVLAQNLLLTIELPPETSGGAGDVPLPVFDRASGGTESSGAAEQQGKVPVRIQPMDGPAAGITLPVEPSAVPASMGRIARTEMPAGAAIPSAAPGSAVTALTAPASAGAQAAGRMPAGTLIPGAVGTIPVQNPAPAPGTAVPQNAVGHAEADATPLEVSEGQVPRALPHQHAPQPPEVAVAGEPKPTGAVAAGAGERLAQAPPESPLPAVALASAGNLQGTAPPQRADGLPPLEEVPTARPAPVHRPLLKQLTAPLVTVLSAVPGQRTMNIHVAPETLGPITVSAQLGPSGLRVDLSAPTDAGTHALRALLPELRREMAALGQGSVQVLSPENAASTGNTGSGAGQGFAGSGQGHFQQRHPDNAPARQHPSPGIPLAEGADTAPATENPALPGTPAPPARPVARLDLLA